MGSRENHDHDLKFVVIGYGIQGKKRHRICGPNVTAIVDPIAADAKFRRIEDVDLHTYDAAFVCTPDSPKYDIVKFLLENKKHALIEKPFFATETSTLVDIKNLALENQVSCYTAYNHRFEPHFVKMKEFLSADELGKIYYLDMFYGNGTARDVKNSPWRDKGLGVIPDLGSHLLDTMVFWFPEREFDFRIRNARCFENKSCDFFELEDSGSFKVTLAASLLSWRNSFRVDIFGEKGSLHINCLCKWGPSELVHRIRTLPSGKPIQKSWILEQPDPTWQLEYDYFRGICRDFSTNIDNDIWIDGVIRGLENGET